MSKLYFKVASDWQEVVRLRTEISKLEAQIKSMDANKAPQAVAVLNRQMQQTKQQMQGMITEAAKAGAAMDNDFKSKIYQSSQSVNDFTQKIINQKTVIKNVEADVKRLGESYRSALKNNPLSASGKLSEYTSAKKALDEEKAALFGLTQEQANARLSVKKLRDEYSLYKDEGKGVVNTTDSIGISLKKAFAIIGGAAAIKQLGSEIIRVRGEFQSMQTAIETLVGKDMAGNLIPQIKELAKVSPLTLSDMVGAEKMMLGFNIKAEDTIRYLQALGDISMGDTQKFNSLTLAFSQMSASGKLMGQDLNQMINAGFNPLQTISEKTGKSIATLKDEMSKGAISAERVQQAFIDATSAGGKFFGMSENASKTINGQLSMMQDAIDEAFNEMGQKSEDVIMSGIQLTTKLVENYETVGRILSGLVITYGVYRTAVMLSTIATGKHTIAEVALTNVRVMARRAQMALNASMLTNPYVLIATVIAGYITTVWALHDSTTAAEASQKSLTDTVNKLIEREEKHKSVIDGLINTANDEKESTIKRNKAMKDLILEYPSIIKKYIDEEGHLTNIVALKREIAELDSKKYVAGLGGVANKNKEYVDFLNQVKSGKIDLHSDKKLLSKYESLQQHALESYNGRSALTIDELVSFYTKRGTGLQNKFNRSNTEDKLSLFSEQFGEKSGDELNELLQSRKKILKQFTDKIGYVYDSAIKDYVKKTDVESQITQIEGVQNGRKNVVQDKSYWEKQKKEAETAIDSIDSKQRKLLNEGKFDKVDSKVVANYKEQKRLIAEAEKELKAYPSISDATKQEKASNKLKKDQEKRNEELLTLQKNNQKSEVDLMEEGSKKKIAQIELDYKNEIASIKKQEEEWCKAQGGKLTEKQSKEISIAYTQTEDRKDKGVSDITKEGLKAEQQALNDYLKEYGTFQQQKLAIAEEYAEKIKQAQEDSGANSSQVKLLEKQRDVAIQNKETEAIKANIDWVTVFGEFGGMFNDMIKPALEDAKKYVQTDNFKNSDQASQKELIDAINQMEKSLGGAGGVSFKKLGKEMQTYQNSLHSLNAAKNEETDAINRLKKAKDVYEKAMKDGTEQEKQLAKDARDTAQQNADAASSNVKTQTDIVNQNQGNLTNAAIGLKAAMENVTGGLNKLASGGLSNAYSGIIQATNGIKDAIGKTSESLKEVPIIGWILSIIDVFKDGLSNFVGPLLDAIFNAISGIISDVFSGDIFVTIGKSLRDGIGSIFNAISFGGWDTLMGKISGSNAKEVQEAIDKLTSRNETLEKSIDRLTEVMDKTAGVKSISAYDQARKYQQEKNDNTLQIAQEQARYVGSHHSWQYYMKWTDEQLNWARENVDKNFSGTGSLWGLSPEKMNLLLSNVDIYDQIKSKGEGGYGSRVMDKLEDYADQAGKLDELTTKINESIAQISFDSLRDSFVDTLMDMDSSAEDFANNFEEYLMRAMLNFSMGDLVDDEMEAWYNNWAETIGKQGGTLTEDQIKQYKKEWDDFVQQGIDKRNELAELTGYDSSNSSSSQSSTQKSFEAMSQDSADELNGRFTALQIAGEEIKNQNILQSQSLNLLTVKADAILTINTETRNIADEIRTIQVNSYLELQEIRENTGMSAKSLKAMESKLDKIEGNTRTLSSK